MLIGCVSDPQPTKMVEDFYRIPSASEQMRQFKQHSLEEQYELYMFGNRVVHPPAIYLKKPFAEQGPVIVPFLKTKLDGTTDEKTIRDIVVIFEELAYLKQYDFVEHPALLELLERKAHGMTGPWKDYTLEKISQIKTAAHRPSPQ